MKLVCPRDPDSDEVCSHCAWVLAFTRPPIPEPPPGQCALPCIFTQSELAEILMKPEPDVEAGAPSRR